jgi:S1-C subfamily serine protease
MSDPESTEIQKFEPPPDQRHSWRAASAGDAGGEYRATPERWFEPAVSAADTQSAPSTASSRGYGRGLVAVLVAAALVGSIFGAAGSYLALRLSGSLDSPTVAPAGGGNQRVSIQSDASTIIAAVKQIGPAVVQIATDDGAGNQSVGSGIVYDSHGWILTNKHVVEGAQTISVRFADDRRLAGTIYGVDTLSDLAIVKVDGATGLTAAPMGNSGSLQVGQLAIAIGSPLGLEYPNTVTTGIVSALGRDITVPSSNPASNGYIGLHGLIQTDAAINPGNSGGPLVDSSGRVIGVTVAEAETAQGIGFAIPIDVAKPIMQQALAGEKLSRPYIGVTYELIDLGLRQQQNLPLSQGAWVHKTDAGGNSVEAVTAGSPGDQAGIKTGDIITQVEGQAIDPLHRLEDVLIEYPPGRTVSVELYRAGSYLTLEVTLGTRPASTN